ncbi:MAG: hypothetical protein ABI321_23830 [Polyangia bacterium]
MKLRTSTRLLATASGIALCATGCGGKRGTINLDIVVSQTLDPFYHAALAQFTIDGVTKTAAVTGSHFTFSFDEKPPKVSEPLIVEALDSTGTVLGYGQTPPISLTAGGQNDSYGVWVGGPGTMNLSASGAVLPYARTELGAFSAVGLGAMFAGGRGPTSADPAATAPVADCALYDVFTNTVIAPNSMTSARAGGSGIASAPQGVIFGGLTTDGSAIATAEIFSPISSSGLGAWTPVPATGNAPAPAAFAVGVLLQSGTQLVAGGEDGAGKAVTSSELVTTGAAVSITANNAMQSARYHHCAAAAKFPDGDGALFVGGITAGSQEGIAEKFVGGNFTTVALLDLPNLWDATATSINTSTGVLVIGGTIPDPVTGVRTATSNVYYIQTYPTTSNPVVLTEVSAAISARAGHTATMVGNDLLLCGGVGADGKLVTACDILTITGNIVTVKAHVNLAAPRRNHVATELQNGLVLIVGGVNDQGAPLGAIEIYTPDSDEQAVINVANGTAAASTH